MSHELPAGFRTAGVHCGVKSDAANADLALFVSDGPATAAGVFTRNLVCGAPVVVSRERVPAAGVRAVVINSGNANACTGERGLDDARWMTSEVAGLLGCEAANVLVCSTGIIGHHLPRERLSAGFPQVHAELAATPDAFESAARGMMTTDTFSKQAGREVEVNGTTVRVAGAGKGAAMIAPNMGTMLAVVMTDAELTPEQADRMLRHAVDRSFNCISVEGDTSTSDTVIVLANGAAGAGPLDDAGLAAVSTAFNEVCEELARVIVRDAEGAEHFVTIDVTGARSFDEAQVVARTIAESPLVKTGITGNDPNWGRIVACVGRSGIAVAESDVSLAINGSSVYEHGAPVPHDGPAISRSMAEGEVAIAVSLSHGEAGCRFWTCDLTAEYVRLNSEYTT